jgi:hypothetical protein
MSGHLLQTFLIQKLNKRLRKFKEKTLCNIQKAVGNFFAKQKTFFGTQTIEHSN